MRTVIGPTFALAIAIVMSASTIQAQPLPTIESDLTLAPLTPEPSASAAAAAFGPYCAAGPSTDFCNFSCLQGDIILVVANGLSGGVLGDCGGRSAQCIVDNGAGGFCSDSSSTLLYNDNNGYCGHTGADLETAAVWTTVIQCGAGPVGFLPTLAAMMGVDLSLPSFGTMAAAGPTECTKTKDPTFPTGAVHIGCDLGCYQGSGSWSIMAATAGAATLTTPGCDGFPFGSHVGACGGPGPNAFCTVISAANSNLARCTGDSIGIISFAALACSSPLAALTVTSTAAARHSEADLGQLESLKVGDLVCALDGITCVPAPPEGSLAILTQDLFTWYNCDTVQCLRGGIEGA